VKIGLWTKYGFSGFGEKWYVDEHFAALSAGADNADLTGFMRSTYSVSENQRESASKMAFFAWPKRSRAKSDTLLFVKSPSEERVTRNPK